MPGAAQYIRPTQGLSLRKGGGTVQVNLENIGGRILVMEEIQTHKTRMKDIRPAVNVQPPWGHQQRKKQQAQQYARRRHTAGAGFAGTAGSGTASVAGSRPQSARTGRPAAAAGGGGAAPGAAAGDYVDVMQILGRAERTRPPEEKQQQYQALVALLTDLTTEDSRTLLEQAYRESEERKLLAAYDGVFPSLVDENDPSGDADGSGGEPPRVGSAAAGADGAAPGGAGIASPLKVTSNAPSSTHATSETFRSTQEAEHRETPSDMAATK